jgi:hypothetical protein
MLPIEFKGQPTVLLKDGSITSCGIRFFGVESPINGGSIDEPLYVSDASFMVDKRNIGMVKALIYKTSPDQMEKNVVPQSIQFNSFWIKANGAQATVPLDGKVLDGDDKNSKLYITDIEPIFKLFLGVLSKDPINIGFKFKDNNDFAFYGKVQISEADSTQISSCIHELGEGIGQKN